MTKQYLSQRQYAKRLGISHTAVQKAVKSDRIRLSDNGLIDVMQADFSWYDGSDWDKTQLPLRAQKIILINTVALYWAKQEEVELKEVLRILDDDDLAKLLDN